MLKESRAARAVLKAARAVLREPMAARAVRRSFPTVVKERRAVFREVRAAAVRGFGLRVGSPRAARVTLRVRPVGCGPRSGGSVCRGRWGSTGPRAVARGRAGVRRMGRDNPERAHRERAGNQPVRPRGNRLGLGVP
ncbi:hypothetical protein Acsp02_43350 [Actinoplanes sp. NBRC 103695]|nr:hypothetical protein Acsp02_43350 [Actinoplanes sp. NBRC 103695]